MKNILIVDDSALMRRVLSDIINKDKMLHVEAGVKDGLEALELLEKRSFDLIVLDLIMPRMNGLEFLQEMKNRGYTQKVIIVSTIAQKGAGETIRALELGAFDFVTKPGSLLDAKSKDFVEKLLHRIHLALGIEWDDGQQQTVVQKSGSLSKEQQTKKDPGNWNPVKQEKTSSCSVKSATRVPHSPAGGVKETGKLVALTCSTGGPKALQSVIPKLPADLDAAVVLVQHMPVGFTASLSARLDEMSAIKVKEAEDGEIIRKGTVYIAKGGSQMRVVEHNRHEFKLSVREEEARNGLKPCADIMYESLMKCSFDDITCVVMTGMGSDGTKGILQLEKTNKIYVIAQDAASSTVYGMPKAVAESGATDEVQDLNLIADAIIKHVGVR